jgi:hypothetical protein
MPAYSSISQFATPLSIRTDFFYNDLTSDVHTVALVGK